MNIHVVLLNKRVDLYTTVSSAAAALGYKIISDDHICVYTNLCVDSRDLSLLRTQFTCEVVLQPLSADDGIALSTLPDVVASNARKYPDDANMLVDANGKCKRARTTIIPSVSSAYRS